MRLATLIAALVLVCSPQLAEAQAGLELSAPSTSAAASAAPAPATTTVPEPPSAATRLSSESQPRWPSLRPTGVDPELLALRGRSSFEAQPFEPAPTTRDDAEEHNGPGFGASLGHAAAGFGIGVGAGGLVGGALGFAACGGSDWCVLGGMLGAGFGALSLAPAGAALGTWGFGEMQGGTGNGFAALGGAYLGAGLGVGLSALFVSEGEGAWAATLAPALGVVLSMLGSAAGYQITSHGGRAEADAGASAVQVSVLPTLSPTEDGQGATVGAVGTF